MIFLDKYPSVKLLSDVRVVNYSSPHSYRFHTGEVLPACSNEVAQDTKLEAHHGKKASLDLYGKDRGWDDISINYSLSLMQEEELTKLAKFDEIDIILVPYPVLNALKECWEHDERWDDVFYKVRVCKLHDRITKVIRADGFGI